MDGSGESQMMVRWSGEVQVRVKFPKYYELDIGLKVWYHILNKKGKEEFGLWAVSKILWANEGAKEQIFKI